MHAPSDRLEVADVEAIGVEIAVPTDDVQRVEVEEVGHDFAVHLHAYFVFAALRVRRQLARAVQVALAVGRVFEQLAKGVAIALGRLDVAPERLHDEYTLGLPTRGRRLHPPPRAAGDHQILALPAGQR